MAIQQVTKYKLKRCVYCNGHELGMHRGEIVSSVYCLDCGAMGPFDYTDFGAINLWNEGTSNPSALVRCMGFKSNRNDEKEIEL